MTTDTEKELEQAAQDEAAGFAAGFTDEAVAAQAPAPVVPAPPAEPEVKKEEEAAPTAPSPSVLTAEDIAAIREVPTLKTQLREANGRIGALNDLLKQERAQKKEEPKAPPAVQLKRTTEHYGELAPHLQEDLAEAFAAAVPTQDPEALTKLVSDKVTAGIEIERKELRRDAVRAVHPDFDEVVASPAFWAWEKTAPQKDRDAIAASDKPQDIVPIITAFKTQRDKTSKAKEESQKRLEQAITPQGVPRPDKQTLSDDEAMAKGFAEGFNS